MSVLADLAILLQLLSILLQGIWLFSRRLRPGSLPYWPLAAAALLLLALIGQRSLEIAFPALTGTYESLVFYSAATALLVLAYALQKRLPFSRAVAFGASVAAMALLALASSPLAPKDNLAPIPALRSGWLLAHVALSFVGEAFFVISFVASLAFLLSSREEARADFDRVGYAAVAVGYPIFTAGALVFGAVWAQRAWGSWWSWDPKETWALVTWLVYTAYLHLRLVRGRRDRLVALVAVVGFLSTVFTFFGVNYLLPGLHSYG